MKEPLEPEASPGAGEDAARPGEPIAVALKPSVWGRLRGYFLAGVLVAAPIGITIALASWFLQLVDGLIPKPYNPDYYLPYRLPGFGLLIVVTSLTLIGWLTSSFVGRFLHQSGERVVGRIPVIRTIYGATKQIFEAVLAQKASAFREVALIEYPRRGVWSIGFLTGTTAGEVQDRTAEETVNIFLPTTPNPTSGYLLFVPRKDLIILEMTVEDGIKMVVSGGIVTPPWPRKRRRSGAEPEALPPAQRSAAS